MEKLIYYYCILIWETFRLVCHVCECFTFFFLFFCKLFLMWIDYFWFIPFHSFAQMSRWNWIKIKFYLKGWSFSIPCTWDSEIAFSWNKMMIFVVCAVQNVCYSIAHCILEFRLHIRTSIGNIITPSVCNSYCICTQYTPRKDSDMDLL